ncbi:MAG: ABC transporter ATP-binding protein [Acidobacteria bacterium]|nr:ABC transporter ATP-binding protein [Acidobacteriota bacterium]
MPDLKHESPISVRHLEVRYGRTVAVAGVDLEVKSGQVYALLGRNGAGKSSLVRCLLGQQRATAGRAALLGHDSWKERARVMTRVGVVPETPDAPPAMTAVDLDAFGARLYQRWDSGGLRARLRSAGIPLDVPFARLSRGERGQLVLGLALAQQPEVLILDDPTLGLDAAARRALLAELVGDLADRGTTVLLASNDLSGVEAIADRVGILRGGALVVEDDLESLKTRFWCLAYRHRGDAEPPAAIAAALGGGEIVRRRRLGWREELVVTGVAVPGPDLAEGEATVESMSLEEIFLALCGPAEGGVT